MILPNWNGERMTTTVSLIVIGILSIITLAFFLGEVLMLRASQEMQASMIKDLLDRIEKLEKGNHGTC